MKNYADKFHMTPEQSLFLAKKKWDENVYCGMRMENRAVTFPQTKTILQGINVPSVQLTDIQAILNMRDAWSFLLGSVRQSVDLDYLCKLNDYIARGEALEWGKLRTGSVMISGTEYLPPVPSAEMVGAELSAILDADVTATAKALEAFAWGARGQFFWDGNKRTGMTLANKILLAAGVGFLTIPERCMEQFNTLLVGYYDSGYSEGLKDFLYENTIQGIEG
ncbi:MAG: Fic family protein [Oscillospiraceae bacterium]|nr:Fic family protein [Oscillospiraceae bacterium]